MKYWKPAIEAIDARMDIEPNVMTRAFLPGVLRVKIGKLMHV